MRRNVVSALLLCADPLAAAAAAAFARVASPAAARSPSVRATMRAASTTSLSAGGRDDNDGDRKTISVAVIGGGIAGLSCARALSKSPAGCFEPTVFDTGRLRPGGRCSSRLPGDEPKDNGGSRSTALGSLPIDHAAQILTVPNNGGDGFEHFARQVKEWEEGGVLREFPQGSVREILHDIKAEEGGAVGTGSGRPFYMRGMNDSERAPKMYHGTNGMGSIPAALAARDNDDDGSSFEIRQDVWVSPNNGVKYTGGSNSDPQWTVKAKGRTLGTYDRLIIAHNGKCADRLMSRTPAKALHSLLRTNFAPTVPAHGGRRMTLNSIYSLTFALKGSGGDNDSPLAKALGEDVITAMVKNHPALRLVTCQSRKYQQSAAAGDAEVWTVLSSPTFAKKYKAPQENISPDTAERVTDLLLTAVEECLDLPVGAIAGVESESGKKEGGSVVESKLQLWGAAVPLNVWEPTSPASSGGESDGKEASSPIGGFLYDPEHGVGAAGDWLLDPSIGGAWESGRRLAEYMTLAEGAEGRRAGGGQKKTETVAAVGLPPNGAFRVSKATAQAGIGNVR